MHSILQAVAEERTIRDVRRTLTDHLLQLSPVSYLVDESLPHQSQVIESLQAPIFDTDGAPRYALTVNGIDSTLEPETLGRMGTRVRAAADEVTSAIAAHTREGWSAN